MAPIASGGAAVAILPPGPTSRTAGVMMQLAKEGRYDYQLRRLAEDITQHVAARDQLSEVLAVYRWVCSNKRYWNDPWGIEMVRDARALLGARGGDCDDLATLIAALCFHLGRHVRFVTGGFTRYGIHSHVWPEVQVGDRWIAVDCVAGPRTRKMLGDVRSAAFFY